MAETTLCVYYIHYQTDGKLENLIKALRKIDTPGLCLDLTHGQLDEPFTAWAELPERLERTLTVVKTLHKKNYTVSLALPGLALAVSAGSDAIHILKSLLTDAAPATIDTIWLDDTRLPPELAESKNLPADVITLARNLRKLTDRVRPQLNLGLWAYEPGVYARLEIPMAKVLHALSGNTPAGFASPQLAFTDYDRTNLLKVATGLAQTPIDVNPQACRWGNIRIAPSGFHKGAESLQMQMNLNAWFGRDKILLSPFDEVGSAPGDHNIFLHALHINNPFLKKLTGKITPHARHFGIGVIHANNHLSHPDWALLLNRMGFPTRLIPTDYLVPEEETETIMPWVLADPQAAAALTKKQLFHLLNQGLIMDAPTAEVLQQRKGLERYLGLDITHARGSLESEILSDDTFAQPYYGQRQVLANVIPAADLRRLTPRHPKAKIITTLMFKGEKPNHPGMILVDDTTHNHRLAVLPYAMNYNHAGMVLLCPARQRHFQDVLAWLARRSLACMVESTPDLIPFLRVDTARRRAMLMLLNLSFDWAVDARIRIGDLGFNPRRLHELSETGNLEPAPHGTLNETGMYRYIQLSPDLAVAPMQMMVLMLE